MLKIKQTTKEDQDRGQERAERERQIERTFQMHQTCISYIVESHV